jgi:hypothetical protein
MGGLTEEIDALSVHLHAGAKFRAALKATICTLAAESKGLPAQMGVSRVSRGRI